MTDDSPAAAALLTRVVEEVGRSATLVDGAVADINAALTKLDALRALGCDPDASGSIGLFVSELVKREPYRSALRAWVVGMHAPTRRIVVPQPPPST